MSPTILQVFSVPTSGGGSYTDGQTAVFTGPTATLPDVVEWLGGNGGVIASGTPGNNFSRTNWSKLFSFSEWQYSTARTLSRSRSLIADSDVAVALGGDSRITQFFDYGASGITSEYFSCNYFCDSGVATTLQWKVRRGEPIADVNDGIDPSWYYAVYKSGPGAFLNVYNQATGNSRYFDNTPPTDEWQRWESWWTCGTVGSSNGTMRIKVTRVSDGTVIQDQTWTGILMRGTSGSPPIHRYAVLQDYLGNESPSGTRLRIYKDDVYLSATRSGSGCGVRAEIWNASSSPTKRAIQEVTGIAGTNWTIKLNQGHLTSLTGAYLVMFNATDTDSSATKVAL